MGGVSVTKDGLNGVTREFLLSLWDISDEEIPRWNNYEYLHKRNQHRLFGEPVGHVTKFGSRKVLVGGVLCDYKSVLNWIKFGVYDNDLHILKSLHNLSDEEFKYCYTIYNSMNGRVGKGRYKDVVIGESFKSLDLFISWAKAQIGFMKVNVQGFVYELDKDLLSPINQACYSAETCLFVPREINALATRGKAELGKGIQYFKQKSKPYRAYSVEDGKSKHLGYYLNLSEAKDVALKTRFEYVGVLEERYGDTVPDFVWSKLFDERFL